MNSKIKQILQHRYPRLFSLLMNVRSWLSLPGRRRAIAAYLAAHDVKKLQLGAGRTNVPGWLNTDYWAKPPHFLYVNVCKRLPFADGQFDRIFSEHMIEHVSQVQGWQLLQECFRILKPGGRMRLETPDLELMCRLYRPDLTPEEIAYIQFHRDTWNPFRKYERPTRCIVLNNIMRYAGHQFLYDEEYLRMVLERAGFDHIERYVSGATKDAHFAGVGGRPYAAFSRFETLVLEAAKPQGLKKQ